jgi:hypothetical protein
MNFQDWCFNTERESHWFPRITCQDGFSFSCQASTFNYCEPREDHPYPFFYSEFELGYPSEADESIMAYAESPDEPTRTVYGLVPKDVVSALVEKHGGITTSKSHSRLKNWSFEFGF